ncbi:MAG: coenzyme A pyrophosphatase [Bacteroidetes bacterium]|nr:MAG: coenzyme A pyrophosphatase [Bacteroidota bacterium]
MESLISFLKKALTTELPGQDAQAIMMPTLSDRSRFSLEAKKGARPGGVMILFYLKDEEIYFPLIQRPDYDGVHAKQMSFPGGKKDDEDESLIITAIRETNEEIGVESGKIEVIGSLSELYIIASNFNVLPTIGIFGGLPDFLADEHEVDEVVEVKLTDLMDDAKQKEKPMTILQGITINAPYFDLNDKVVWGATAMILSELKQILQPFYKNQ